jgi:hypothetical protein
MSQRLNFVSFLTGDFSELFSQTNAAIVTTPTHSGAYALRLTRTSSIANIEIRGIGPDGQPARYSAPTAYYRIFLQLLSYTGEFGLCNCLDTGGTGKFFLHIDGTGKLKAFQSDSGQLGLGTRTLALNTWHQIELMVGTGNPASWEVRLNGTTELSGTTANLGTNNNGSINIGGGSNYTSDYVVDDIAIDSGTWVGSGNTAVLLAAGPGTYTQWAEGPFPQDWTEVSKAFLSGDISYTTYVATSVLSNAFTVRCASTTSQGVSGVVNAIKGMAFVSCGVVNVSYRLRSGGINSNAPQVGNGGNPYVLFADIANVDPATSAPWILAAVDAAEFGLVHAGPGGNGAFLAYLAFMVDYTPGTSSIISPAGITSTPTLGTPTVSQLQPGVLINSVDFETGNLSQCFTSTGAAAIETTIVHRGTYSLRLNRPSPGSTANVEIRAPGGSRYNAPVAYYRIYQYIESYSTEFAVANFLANDGSPKFYLHVTTGGFLKAFDFLGNSLVTGTHALPLGSWQLIEVKISTGNPSAWEVRLNGTTEISGSNNLGTVNNGAVIVGGGSAYIAVVDYDDIAISSNTWIGPTGGGASTISPIGITSTPVLGTPIVSQIVQIPTGRVNFVGFNTGDATECAVATHAMFVTSPVHSGSFALELVRTGAAAAYVEIRGQATDGTLFYYAASTIYYRFFLYIKSFTGEFGVCNCLDNAGGGKFFLHIDGTGKLKAYDGNSNPLGTGTHTLPFNAWNRLELKVGTGANAPWEVRLGGNTELSGTSSLLGNSPNGAINLGGTSTTYVSDTLYDDLSIDSLNWIGDGFTAIIHPIGPGTYSQWTTGTAPSDWTQVAGMVPDPSHYVATATTGNAFTVRFATAESAGVTGVVAAIKGCAIARNAATSQTVLMDYRLRAGGSNFDGAVKDPGTNFTLFADVLNTNPATQKPWTIAAVDALEFGMVNSSSPSGPSQLDYLAVMIDWAGSTQPGGTIIISPVGITSTPVLVTPTVGFRLAGPRTSAIAAMPIGSLAIGGAQTTPVIVPPSVIQPAGITSTPVLAKPQVMQLVPPSGIIGPRASLAAPAIATFSISGAVPPPSTGNVYYDEGRGGLLAGGMGGIVSIYRPPPMGGLLTGSKGDLVTIYTVVYGMGGVLVGSTADISTPYSVQAAGGLVVGGQADITSTYSIVSQGGILAGSTSRFPILYRIYSDRGIGGVLLGGTADLNAHTFSVDATGGVLLSSTADITSTYAISAIGGVLAGSIADLVATPVFQAQGGLLAGSTADIAFVVGTVLSGGLLAGGTADVTFTPLSQSATGGVLVGGITATPQFFTNALATGGLLAGSHATLAVNWAPVGMGGVLVGGKVSITSTDVISSKGGVLVGGTGEGTAAHVFSENGIGGVLVGSVITLSGTYGVTAQGGLLAGSTSDLAPLFVGTAQGGVLVGSSAEVDFAVFVQATGGILAGGTADVLHVTQIATAQGGVLVGSTADFQQAIPSISAQGGLLVSSTADEIAFFSLQATGGILVGSISTVSPATITVTTAGGILVGGVADLAVFGGQTTGGGVLLGGIICIVAFGGVPPLVIGEDPLGDLGGGGSLSAEDLCGATAFSETAIGGLVVGGTATLVGLAPIQPQGGILVGSTADVIFVSQPTLSGGLLVGSEVPAISGPLIGGGVLVGSTVDLNIVFMTHMQGGLLAGGTSAAAKLYVVSAQGGLLAGSTGLAIGSTGTYSGIGGLLAGGIAAVTLVHNQIAATGGILVGGKATAAFSVHVSASGGLLAGSTSTKNAPFITTATGGILVGGVGDVLAHGPIFASGGLLAGSTATVVDVFVPVAGGGILVGGKVAVVFSASLKATGGLLAGSTSPQGSFHVFVDAGQGGLVAGGQANAKFVPLHKASGGLIVGSGADLGLIYAFRPKGGIVVGSTGQGTEQRVYSEDAIGGIKVGGHVLGMATYNEPTQGGLLAGGHATASTIYAFAGQGGLVAGGMADVIKPFHDAATGGLLAGGVFTTIVTYRHKATGGLLAGGVADRHVIANYQIRGGLLVGSHATPAVIYANGGFCTEVTGAALAAQPIGFLPISGSQTVHTCPAHVLASGGVLCGSAGTAAIQHPATAIGGILIGGTTEFASVKLPPVIFGGVLVGGHTTPNITHGFRPTGGVLIGGRASRRKDSPLWVGHATAVARDARFAGYSYAIGDEDNDPIETPPPGLLPPASQGPPSTAVPLPPPEPLGPVEPSEP